MKEAESKRVFLAVALPQTTRAAIFSWSQHLKSIAREHKIKASWTKEEQYHVTVRFFGDTPSTQLDAIHEATAQTLANFDAFTLAFDALGAFRSWQRARILWLGAHDAQNQLQAMFTALNEAYEEAGLEPETYQTYHPHVTLARIRHTPPRAPQQALEPLDTPTFEPVPITHLTLFESRLHPKGALYTPLQEYPLPTP